MPNEALRRKAGAAGIDSEGEPEPEQQGKKNKKTPAEVQKILRPNVLEPKPCTLVVPLEFTLGDLIQREVGEDYDAYVQLVMVETAELSGKSDLHINHM